MIKAHVVTERKRKEKREGKRFTDFFRDAIPSQKKLWDSKYLLKKLEGQMLEAFRYLRPENGSK